MTLTIRHAIELAWNRGDKEAMAPILGSAVIQGNAKPTNSEYLHLIADYIRRNLKER
ncbi:uncharacterized protein YhfF [Pullulanibacillus pueri]|uniref:sporulation initiation factor Spo0A C-terminal domain-containing protein n=1 Tax=Pullulanibacillus pueri TaxID=1437324 RepID=UPI001666E95B|nr:sporulation initiation factor Spo0A C-terminal domain-containing protein [Pullulanibacillus pueri]MBM7683561.1 uncharacterized protein YhfF [Pullulanibacillus pueri]